MPFGKNERGPQKSTNVRTHKRSAFQIDVCLDVFGISVLLFDYIYMYIYSIYGFRIPFTAMNMGL